MKKILVLVTLAITGLVTAQEDLFKNIDITITGTSLHLHSDTYKSFIDTSNDDTIQGTAYLIDGKEREGYIVDKRYNPVNIGLVFRKKDGIVLGAYYNSYYNPSFLLGYNKSIAKGISVDVGAVTGYDYIGWQKGKAITPMYAINLDLGNIVRAMVNHEFISVGIVVLRR